jgi:hypothetical protein
VPAAGNSLTHQNRRGTVSEGGAAIKVIGSLTLIGLAKVDLSTGARARETFCEMKGPTRIANGKPALRS